MIYTQKIQRAIGFAIRIHEVDQKQKRKGKDIPYIIHPLLVGFILASAKAEEDLVVAGILHDTIEDSIPEKKVTNEIIIKKFGNKVAKLVYSVTEPDKTLPWKARKREALEHIKTFSHNELLLKSADILSSLSELLIDYKKFGDEVFSRFNASEDLVKKRNIKELKMLLDEWPGNPLREDLQKILENMKAISK